MTALLDRVGPGPPLRRLPFFGLRSIPRTHRPESMRPTRYGQVGQDPVCRRHRRRPGEADVPGVAPKLRERFAPDFVVVNGENAAGGLGITPKIANQLFAAGVDVITLGNHTYRQREIYEYLDERREILRPANFLRSQPGPRLVRGRARRGARLGVVSLSGNLFMDAGRTGIRRGRRRSARAARRGRPHPCRHARRGDEREGRDGLVSGRARHRRRRHAYPCRRPPMRGPSGRHRLHHRCGDDGSPRWRDRRQA